MSREILERPAVLADLRIKYGDDPSQFFDVWNAKGAPAGLVIMIHGGFWRSQYDLTHASHLCAEIARTGVAAASLEYRRTGPTGGGWPQTFGDILSGFDAVRDHFPGMALPVVAGHSAGGHLALRLASERSNLLRVVALAPVACLDLPLCAALGNGAVGGFIGGGPAEYPERYHAADPSIHPASVLRLCIHGADDDVVPVEVSKAFVKRREWDSPSPRLIEITGADHFDLIDPQSNAWPAVRKQILTGDHQWS